jgi:hypothetical protein
MDPVRFDILTRALTTPSSRRAALATVLGGSLGLLGLAGTTAKNQKKGKKKNKNGGSRTGQPPSPPSPPSLPSPPSPSAPSCAETCASPCAHCLTRAAGPPLCGDGYGMDCGKPACSSDNDCSAVPGRPYCITGGVDRPNGNPFSACGDSSGRCASIIAC